MFRREVRDFARRELAPGARERAKMDSVPWEIMRRMGEMGLLGINVPGECGLNLLCPVNLSDFPECCEDDASTGCTIFSNAACRMLGLKKMSIFQRK